MNDESRNLILATALSVAVLLLWFVLFPPPEPEPTQTAQPLDTTTAPLTTDGVASAPPAVAGQSSTTVATSAEPALETDRIDIRTARLSGSIALTGGRIDDLHLTDYFVTLEQEETVTLLSPAGTGNAYYAIHGWIPTAALGRDGVPNASTPWQVESGSELTETSPVTLRWDNGAGLIFRKTISVDENYMFEVRQSVENQTGTDLRLAPYGIIARHGLPDDRINFYILPEGVVRKSDGEINEIDYDDMPDFDFDPREGGAVEIVSTESNGWIGFTDKYWMTTLIPTPGLPFTSVVKYTQASDTYQTDVRMAPIVVPAGATAESVSSLFAGAKEGATISMYETERNVERFIDSIDWGWFFYFTKPIHWALVALDGITGNMGVAIILLTLIIKLILLPLAWKSYSSMAKMKALQPEMEKIKERAGDDRQKLQTEMMEMYKKNKVNPASGCLPILVQIPIFFSLYKVLFVAIEIRHAPFFGWIDDLAAPDPTSIWNLFGALPYDVSFIPQIMALGVWPLLLGISMYLQQKLNPAPTDPMQAQIFAWLPWVFMFMLGSFASGLVIYWVANNFITFAQQYLIMRQQGVNVDVLGNIKAGIKRKKPATK
ncbi:MAG: membrane protein insertase YidC [Pseudomonadota bacterium]